MQRSAYKMKDAADQYVAGLYVGAHATNVIPTVHISDGDAAYEQLIDVGVLLDEANDSEEGRNCIAPPWFFGLLRRRALRSRRPDLVPSPTPETRRGGGSWSACYNIGIYQTLHFKP